MTIDRRSVAVRLLPWLLLAISLGLLLLQVQRPASLVRVWVPWAETGALALVMTAIVLTGGIDLSVGSIVALSGVVQGVLFREAGWPIEAAAAAGIATGTVCGLANGALVGAGLSPLVATLATMAFYAGLAMTVSGAERIAGFPDEFLAWSRVAGVPAPFWLLAALAAIAYATVHHTRFGRWCYAIGDNRLAATIAAVPVRRVELQLYAASGLVAGLVSVLYTMDRDAAIPDAHRGIELQAIACVVVGGTSITGGRGGIPQTLLGLAVIANLDIALEFLGARVGFLTAESRLIVIGFLLIAVAVWNERVAGQRTD